VVRGAGNRIILDCAVKQYAPIVAQTLTDNLRGNLNAETNQNVWSDYRRDLGVFDRGLFCVV